MPTEKSVFQLTYYSTARSGISNEDIEEILTTARKHNAANDITGCLLFHNGEFLQILEGAKLAILSLFEKIKVDPRHETILKLSENNAKKRSFGQWTMAYHNIIPEDVYTNTGEENLFISNFKGFSGLVEQQGPSFDIFWGMAKHLIAE
jgi:hypothetical protein